MLFIARMATQHFTFEAAGRTEKEAKQALFLGWQKHLHQSARSYDRARLDSSGLRETMSMSLDELDEWYGIKVAGFEPGTFLRDGAKI